MEPVYTLYLYLDRYDLKPVKVFLLEIETTTSMLYHILCLERVSRPKLCIRSTPAWKRLGPWMVQRL